MSNLVSRLERLESMDPDIVYDFIATGKSEAISKQMQIYIQQIQWASEIWEVERNTTRAARKLQERIMANQNMRVAIHVAKSRLFDAMQYFDVDQNVAQEIWDRDTANKLEDLAKLAIAQDKLDVAKRCYDRANELRARANEALNPADLQPPLFLISTRITPEELGYQNENLMKISRKATEGFYARMIAELPLEKSEKLRLMADAEIEDIEFEEIEDEGSGEQ